MWYQKTISYEFDKFIVRISIYLACNCQLSFLFRQQIMVNTVEYVSTIKTPTSIKTNFVFFLNLLRPFQDDESNLVCLIIRLVKSGMQQ